MGFVRSGHRSSTWLRHGKPKSKEDGERVRCPRKWWFWEGPKPASATVLRPLANMLWMVSVNVLFRGSWVLTPHSPRKAGAGASSDASEERTGKANVTYLHTTKN